MLTGAITVNNNKTGKNCKKPACGQKGKKCNNKPDRKKSIKDYYFCIRSVNRVSDYDETSQLIANHIKKLCVRSNDTSKALRANVKPDMAN